MPQEGVDTEPILRRGGPSSAPEEEIERPTERVASHVSIKIPGSGEEVAIFVPLSLSRPRISAEGARCISESYKEAYGAPNQPKEDRLHKQICRRLGALLTKVELNLQSMSRGGTPKEQSILIYDETRDPQKDFVDHVTYVLFLENSSLQFEDPVEITSKGRRRGETIETDYRRSALLEELKFPGVLALVEESTFAKAGKGRSLIGRRVYLQFLSPRQWEQLMFKAKGIPVPSEL